MKQWGIPGWSVAFAIGAPLDIGEEIALKEKINIGTEG